LWIQYFYQYLKPTARAGFVMASCTSDAGHSEKDIREKLAKTGAVDVMMAIGNNFFYTRSLPCTLWFFDRAKEKYLNQDLQDLGMNRIINTKDNVLLLDARKIYRKVISKVNDFSPEQLQNLICIVNLYRGNTKKFETTVKSYLKTAADLAAATAEAITELQKQLKKVVKTVSEYCLNQDSQDFKKDKMIAEWREMDIEAQNIFKLQTEVINTVNKNHENHLITEITVQTKALRKPQDKLIKQLLNTINTATKEY